MPRPYSLDLRARAVAAAKAGKSSRQVAAMFSIGVSTAVRWTGRERETGSPAARPMGGKRPYALAGEREWVLRRVAERPDITLQEMLAELAARDVKVSYYGLWNFCRHLGLRFKKKPCTPANKTGPTWRGGARSGGAIKARSSRNGWCSSMKPAPRRT
jgi:transposase